MLKPEDRLTAIYLQYIDVVCPYVAQYELLDNNFPIEILNEIRATFTHLAKAHLTEQGDISDKNLSKAEGHIKRAILDCYKYLCTAFEDKYIEFERRYKRVDLSLVDNGAFLPKLLSTRKLAIEQLLDARKTDFAIDSDDEPAADAAYEKYETAFNTYLSMYNMVIDSYEKVDVLKKRVILKDLSAALGYAIGLAGIILTIVFGFAR